ncbi:MAG TPA: hypothetical protein VGR03_03445 [Candidatus Acidoferrum sp.]|nr:hypothetical protein [Candidatus Acidoferrum sp.]
MKRHFTAEHPWVGHVRRFSAALIAVVSIIEHLLIRIFRSGERVLFHLVIFGGVVYAVYEIIKHH